MATWADIKLKALQKMFAANGDTIPTDSSTVDYIASMPGAANEALQMLATAGKFIIKHIDIAHTPVPNAYPHGDKVFSQIRGDMKFVAENVRSITFAYTGVGSFSVMVGGLEVIKEDLPKTSGFTTIKKLVSNEYDDTVTLTISSKYPISVMNVGMYEADYETEEDIQPYAEKLRYDLKKLAPDFYMLTNEGIVFEGDMLRSRYETTDNYLQEGGTVLVLDRTVQGNFKAYYKAYPQQITNDTPDDTELAIDDEVAALIPLYIASELYKEDDNGIATQYRNEFEVAFERLKDSIKAPSSEHFQAESGWV